MREVEDIKIAIVGGGPAGLATALHLAQRAPTLARDMVIIEAKQHPRPKLCGGGITFHGEDQLDRLGLHIDAPAFNVHQLDFRFGEHVFTTHCNHAMRIFDRAEFDAALARAVTDCGLPLRSNERLLDLRRVNGSVELTTDKNRYRAKVVVAADGTNSIVRRKLRMFTDLGIARLLRVMTPINPEHTPAWREHTAVFDFSCVQHGIQGYMWDFPCYVDDVAYMNRGIFDSRIAPEPFGSPQRGNLKQTFAQALQTRSVDLDSIPLKGHPVRWFNPKAEFSRPHVLLAGDAAGVDPLFAEGISYALEYGSIVAETLQDAFDRNNFSFENYRERLLQHTLGQSLRKRALAANFMYRGRWRQFIALLWQMANVSPARVKRAIGATLDVLPP